MAWHRAYDDPGSVLSRRLVVVRALIAEALEAAQPGPISLLSVCAGDGRDVLGVLAEHPRAPDVTALLVELDPQLAAAGRRVAADLGLDAVTVETGDAGLRSWYEAARPADVVCVCGVFGNVEAADVRRTIEALAVVVSARGCVVWTRHRRDPDQTPAIRGWFADAGFEERRFVTVPASLASVGMHQLAGEVRGGRIPGRLFTFVGDGSAAHC